MKIKKTAEDYAIDIFAYLFMGFCAIITLVPVINLFSKAVSDPAAVTSGKVGLLPVGFQLDTLKQVVVSGNFLNAFKNSIFITVIGTLFSVFITALTAYPLSKRNLSGIKALLLLFVFTMLFSGGLVPTYLLIKNLGLYNSPWALVLPAAVNVYNMLIIKNYYESLPDSLEESAKLDGAGNFTILIRIILPLSKPVIATILLFEMVAFWNDYYNAMIYITDINLKTLQIYMAEIVMEAQQDLTTVSVDDMMNTSPEGMRAATILASAIPIICVYPFMQKYFIKGILIGSVKG